jgi:hypothetical protein
VLDSSLQLEKEIAKEWREFSREKCAKMLDEIPYQLQLVIENNAEHIRTY